MQQLCVYSLLASEFLKSLPGDQALKILNPLCKTVLSIYKENSSQQQQNFHTGWFKFSLSIRCESAYVKSKEFKNKMSAKKGVAKKSGYRSAGGSSFIADKGGDHPQVVNQTARKLMTSLADTVSGKYFACLYNQQWWIGNMRGE